MSDFAPTRPATAALRPVAADDHRPHRRRVPLVDLDPDLAAGLDRERLLAARAAVLTPAFTVRRGPWPLPAAMPALSAHMGLLVVDGVAVREVMLNRVISSELVGPGDLIVPWAGDPDAVADVRWQVLATLRIAVLDQRCAVAMHAFPEMSTALLARLARSGQRLATLKAISQLTPVDQRILALFRHIAVRWGRVTREGIAIPLTISHRLVGELVGARRPTVSAAAGILAREGILERKPDGTWLLHERLAAPGPHEAPPVVRHRRRLLPEPVAESS